MPPRLPPLVLLKTFEVAARHLSFKRAAAELHVTPAAVSQQIRALEDALRQPLFERRTRAVVLTDTGERLLPGVRSGLQQLADAVQAACAPSAASILHVTAPPSFATHWLLPRWPAFQAEHPQVTLRLTSTHEAVDAQGAEASTLGRGGDQRHTLAIVFGRGAYPGRQVELLLRPDYLPVCAPGLLAQAPLEHPADLRHHALIHDETLSVPGRGLWGWADWLRAAGADPARDPRAPRELRLSNAALAIEAALAGQGVLLAARPLVAAHLAAGRLVAPFDGSVAPLPSPCAYHLVTGPSLAKDEVVQAFRAWLLAQAGSPGHVEP